MDKWWEEYQVEIPNQTIGDWKIKTGKMSEEHARRFPEDTVPPGEYTALMNYEEDEWKVVMADSNVEIADGLPFVAKAYGRVLLTGLGLGIVPHMLAQKPNVDQVVIVEHNPEVVDMVKDTLPPSTKVIIDNAFKHRPWELFDCAWHDIWTTINPDMATESEELFEWYEPYVDGFQMGWLYEAMKVLRKFTENEQSLSDKYMRSAMSEFNTFENNRSLYIDKSKWDNKTQSKLGAIYNG